MSNPHTFTTNYGIIKPALGSNAFDNPYHSPWNTSMDLIDYELYRQEVFSDNFSAHSGYGYVNAVSSDPGSYGIFTGSFYANTPKQTVFSSAGQYGQHPFSTNLVGDTTFYDGSIAFFPVIASFSISGQVVYIDLLSIIGSPKVRLLIYDDNGGLPGSLIGDTGSFVYPSGSGLLDVGTVSLSENIPPGRLVWVAFWVGSTAIASGVTPRGCDYSSSPLVGGYSDSGDLGSSLRMLLYDGSDTPADISSGFWAAASVPAIFLGPS